MKPPWEPALGEETRAITEKLLEAQCEQSESNKTPGGPSNKGTHNTVNLASRSFTGILQEIPGKVSSAFLLGVGGWGGVNLK